MIDADWESVPANFRPDGSVSDGELQPLRLELYAEMKIFLTLLVWKFELQKCPVELSGYASMDALTHAPQQCFVRLKSIA